MHEYMLTVHRRTQVTLISKAQCQTCTMMMTITVKHSPYTAVVIDLLCYKMNIVDAAVNSNKHGYIHKSI